MMNLQVYLSGCVFLLWCYDVNSMDFNCGTHGPSTVEEARRLSLPEDHEDIVHHILGR